MIALASLPPWNEGVHVGRPSDRIGGECRVRSVARAARIVRSLPLRPIRLQPLGKHSLPAATASTWI